MSEEKVTRAAQLLDEIERGVEEFHRMQLITDDEKDLIFSVARQHFERVKRGENAEVALNKLQAMKGLLEIAQDPRGIESFNIYIPNPVMPVPQGRVLISRERLSDILTLLRVLVPEAKKGEKTITDLQGSLVINPILVIPGRPPSARMTIKVATHPELGFIRRIFYDVQRFPPEEREKEAGRILAELAVRYGISYGISEQQLHRGPFLMLYIHDNQLRNSAERFRQTARIPTEEAFRERLIAETSFHANRILAEDHIRSLIQVARTYHRLSRRPGAEVPADSILESVARLLVNDARLLAREENIEEEEALQRLIEVTRRQARSFTRWRTGRLRDTVARPIRDLVHLHEFLRRVEERAKEILQTLRKEEERRE